MINYLAVGLLFLSAGEQQAEPYQIALSGVTVVDVQTGELKHGSTVLIEGEHIRWVGPSAAVRLSPGTREIPAVGKYLIPGLMETHGHVHVQWARQPADTARFLGWLVASGVTTFRDASAARLEGHLVEWRDAAEQGRIVAPHLYISAVPHGQLREQVGATTGAEAIQHFPELGIGAVKIMRQSPEETLSQIAEARRIGLPAFGHTVFPRPDGGRENRAIEMIRAGLSGISHVAGVLPLTPTDPPPFELNWDEEDVDSLAARLQAYHASHWLKLDAGDVQAVIDTLVRYDVWLEPTLTARWVQVSGEYDASEIRPYHPWESASPLPFTPEDREIYLASYRRMEQFVRRFHEAGGMVVTGSDYYPLPPLGVSEEMRLLVRAGLSPLDALRAATINAARALEMEERAGSVEAGKIADLVLLNANPLDDILAVRDISAVVVGGRFLDRTALDELRAQTSTWTRDR